MSEDLALHGPNSIHTRATFLSEFTTPDFKFRNFVTSQQVL